MNIMEPLFITRRALFTLSNGSKVMAQLSIPRPARRSSWSRWRRRLSESLTVASLV